MKQDLINPALFGNDAGEDEPLEVLNSYFLQKPEFDHFLDANTRLAFVRSRKGIGKSALLRQALFRRQTVNEGELILYVKASDLIALQEIDHSSPSALVHGWQQRMCSRINLELGATLRVALSDDAITLVERSELSGFRDRNLVGSLLDRLKVKVAGFELGRQRVEFSDSQAILQRFAEKKEINVWLLIDDVDATFLNTEDERLSVSTFFSACRNLATSVRGLNIRASVRTDVWSILTQYDEALDKCEQYMLDLRWSTEETGRILANKITSFYDRTYGSAPKVQSIFGLVFKEPFHWGKRRLEAFRPIHILSAGRPRWATQLCRMAGKEAFRVDSDLISISSVRFCLKEYGQSRLADLYKEHRHQCPQMELLVEAFASSVSQYSTTELLAKVQRDIIVKYGKPQIDGGAADRLAVAHFLFRIGFLNGRDDRTSDAPLAFVAFEQRPHLLSSRQNPDDGLGWEIHPSYKAVLRISSGTEYIQTTRTLRTRPKPREGKS
jgi:hypothetical protein